MVPPIPLKEERQESSWQVLGSSSTYPALIKAGQPRPNGLMAVCTFLEHVLNSIHSWYGTFSALASRKSCSMPFSSFFDQNSFNCQNFFFWKRLLKAFSASTKPGLWSFFSLCIRIYVVDDNPHGWLWLILTHDLHIWRRHYFSS